METRESAGVRPQGWSSLTRVHRDALPSPDPFPSLLNKNSAQESRRHTPQQAVGAPFVSVIRNGSHQGTPASRGREQTTDEIVLRLREQHNWVDELFVRDILGAVNGSEDAASAQLYAMAPDDYLLTTTPTPVAGTEVPCDSASIDDTASSRASSLTIIQEPDVTGAVVSVEADDVYIKFRKEALRMSRARDKHARLAYNAFMLGDHSLAKKFSREARELWREAERLHAQAAAEILIARNPGGEGDIWSLDLHGLHASEAVMALQQRLAHLEEELSKNSTLVHGLPHREGSISKAHNGDSAQTVLQGVPRPVLKKELTVITGAGRHSKGGPSIPVAIRNFLLTQRYKFNDSRPGVLVVVPKRRFT